MIFSNKRIENNLGKVKSVPTLTELAEQYAQQIRDNASKRTGNATFDKELDICNGDENYFHSDRQKAVICYYENLFGMFGSLLQLHFGFKHRIHAELADSTWYYFLYQGKGSAIEDRQKIWKSILQGEVIENNEMSKLLEILKGYGEFGRNGIIEIRKQLNADQEKAETTGKSFYHCIVKGII
jgi:hypothetical protein